MRTNPFKTVKYALNGLVVLITTERHFKIHCIVAIAVTIAGFYFDISRNEWLIQLLIIAVVLGFESINTAIEHLANFVHPTFHKSIGIIKDISAAAVLIICSVALIIAGIIYFPKIIILFLT